LTAPTAPVVVSTRRRLHHPAMLQLLADLWLLIVPLGHIVGAIGVTIDAVLRKRQVSAVIGWVGLAWLAPIVGSLLYVAFGINRIQRAAVALQREPMLGNTGEFRATQAGGEFLDTLAAQHPSLPGLARLGFQTTGNPLLPGNTITPLRNGEEAYPAMLAAIASATETITLLSYIFDHDRVGVAFLDALRAAVARGVQVRVLIDDVGARYSRPSMVTHLQEAGVTVATFLPTRLPRLFRYANLRNHRKLLVVDGRVGFTGGMNIRAGHVLSDNPAAPVRCLHFRLEGPIVYELQRTFAVDWAFATREALDREPWFPRLARHGQVVARGIPDGPDADLENILELMLGALSAAQSHVRIISPYFLVDDVLLRALQVTAMRGVTVDIVVPERSNLPVMDWAMTPQFVPLLDKGCRVHTSPPPFDHTKAFTVDGQWSLIGSTNWDARSLMLNFEFNVECYDPVLTQQLDALIDDRIAAARPLSLAELRARSLPVRFRDGVARLGLPYL
jgi:cardiolipin synthase